MKIIGRCAFASNAAASFMKSSSGTTRVDGNEVGITSSTLGISRMSAGRQTYTGPIGGGGATLIARRNVRNSEAESVTSVDHLVNGLANATKSPKISASIG